NTSTTDDLYIATRASPTDAWSVEAVIAELVATTNDFNPIARDALEVWFASDTGGPSDIWRASRTTTMVPFGPAAPVTQLNSSSSDVPGWISPDRRRMYLSSDRDGDLDLYL